MYYDTGANVLYWWNGTAWVSGSGGTASEVFTGPGPTTPPGSQVLWIDTAAVAPTSPSSSGGALKIVSTAADYQANSFEFVSVTGYQTVTLPQTPAVNDYVVVQCNYQYGCFAAVTPPALIMGTVYRGTAGPFNVRGYTSTGFRFDGTNWQVSESATQAVPAGGTYTSPQGQVLTKNSATDWDLKWATPFGYTGSGKTPSMGSSLTAGQVLIKYGASTGSSALPTTNVVTGSVTKFVNLGSVAVTVTPGAGQTLWDKTGATIASVSIAPATFIEWTLSGTIWHPTAWGS